MDAESGGGGTLRAPKLVVKRNEKTIIANPIKPYLTSTNALSSTQLTNSTDLATNTPNDLGSTQQPNSMDLDTNTQEEVKETYSREHFGPYLVMAHGKKGSSMRLVIVEMVKEGGVLSFWRGNGINILKLTPETGLKFACYDAVKHKIKGNQKEFTIYQRFIAGSAAGCVTQTVLYPMEVVRTRLTLRKTGQYSGMVDAAMKMYKIEGRRCFFLGYCANVIGIIPFAGVDLSVYETLKETYRSKWKDPSPPSVIVLICGVISSFLAQSTSYPLGLVRTKLQVQVHPE
ncbi:mitochondrial adenyl nucleotide antiporter SLC25A23-like [Anabrus simplex]|uniref:mitochondrial adenyl nucleotide antiporter SLC25A23-like n=1 Tax=Anabrus simplex TaxID=316456 RepID=UPI0035A36892